MKSKHFLQIQRLVKYYLDNDEDVVTLSEELHYLSCKRMRKAVGVGIVIGWFIFYIVLSWAN